MLKNKKDLKKSSKFSNKGSIRAVRPIHIAEDLSWNYGEDVVVYDVREKTPFVSYYIVASAQTERRLDFLKKTAEDSLYDNYKDVDHIEGRNDSKWILVDAHDVVIQLFTREERQRVDFDSIYQDCPHKVVKATAEPSYKRRKKPESQQR